MILVVLALMGIVCITTGNPVDELISSIDSGNRFCSSRSLHSASNGRGLPDCGRTSRPHISYIDVTTYFFLTYSTSSRTLFSVREYYKFVGVASWRFITILNPMIFKAWASTHWLMRHWLLRATCLLCSVQRTPLAIVFKALASTCFARIPKRTANFRIIQCWTRQWQCLILRCTDFLMDG